MKTITALEAKNAFGQFLDAAAREPVTVTKNGRSVGAMFSMQDLDAMAKAYLSPVMQQGVAEGRIAVTDALIRQASMDARLALAEGDVAEGRTAIASDVMARLRGRIRGA